MTSPDKRNITDQRFHDDATLRYLMNTEPARTHAEWLAYFHEQFGGSYIVTAPQAPGGHWRASATFGSNDQLFEWAPADLLAEMRRHCYRYDHDQRQQIKGQIDGRLGDVGP
jgi:hypothetical protein